MAALDPSYVFVNWVAVPPQPVHLWAVPTILQMANAPAPVLHFPNLFTVRNRDSAHALCGTLTAQYPGIYCHTWDLLLPIENYVR